MLPAYFDTRDPEAVRGTQRVRAVDPNLIVGFNRQRQQLEIWGPHYRGGGEAGGWGCIVPVSDDRGVPFRSAVPWDLIAAELVRLRPAADRAGARAVQAMAERNARLRRGRELEISSFQQSAAEYFRDAIVRDQSDSRWDPQDVLRGWRQKWV